MDRTALEALLAAATEARNLAHAAYETALRNVRAEGDSRTAYHALLKANEVMHKIERMITEAITAQIDAPVAPEEPKAKALVTALVVPNFPDSVRSCTYSVGYGRALGARWMAESAGW